MKNKNIVSLQSWKILLIFGTSVGLTLASSQMVSASPQGGAPGPNTSNSNQGAGSADKCTVYKPCPPQDWPNNAEQSQAGSQGTAPDSSDNSSSSNPNQEAINHINQAQSALQNGDTAGAQMHMDLAKQSLSTTQNCGTGRC